MRATRHMVHSARAPQGRLGTRTFVWGSWDHANLALDSGCGAMGPRQRVRFYSGPSSRTAIIAGSTPTNELL